MSTHFAHVPFATRRPPARRGSGPRIYLSSVFTLEPGDVVATGTPRGMGFARTPPRWLRAGEEVVVSVEGLGELRNPIVAEE